MKKMIITAIMFIAAVATVSVYADSQNKEKMKKTRSETFIHENKVEWENIGDGVKRQILGYDGQVMMVKIKAEKKRSCRCRTCTLPFASNIRVKR